MPSRKRNKGKERRSRKVEARLSRKRQTWQEWCQWSLDNEKVQCSHGRDVTIPPQEQIVSGFLDHFFNSHDEPTPLSTVLLDSFETFPSLWKDDHLRNKAIDLLVVMATNYMLFTDQFGHDTTKSSITITKAIASLENYDGRDGLCSTFLIPKVTKKMRDLETKRDIIKYLHKKRISCSCLKQLYAQRHTMKKLGTCANCLEQSERASLMWCGNCRYEQYCGKDCQRAAWHIHKEQCEEYLQALAKHNISRQD